MSILNVNKINPVGGGSTVTIAGIASVTGSISATTFQGDGAQLTGIIPSITPEKFGAIAKPVIEPETRTWYNAMSTKPKREHLRKHANPCARNPPRIRLNSDFGRPSESGRTQIWDGRPNPAELRLGTTAQIRPKNP